MRSCFQAEIFSLSLFTRMNRETTFRLPCLTTFFWIPARVLQLKRCKWVSSSARYWTSLHGQISNRLEDGLVEFIHTFPLQSPIKHLTHVATSPAEVDEILIVGDRILERRESEVRLYTIMGNVPVSMIGERQQIRRRFELVGYRRSLSQCSKLE